MAFETHRLDVAIPHAGPRRRHVARYPKKQEFVIGGYRPDGSRGVDALPVGYSERSCAGQRHDTQIDPKAVGAFRLTTGSDRPKPAGGEWQLLANPNRHWSCLSGDAHSVDADRKPWADLDKSSSLAAWPSPTPVVARHDSTHEFIEKRRGKCRIPPRFERANSHQRWRASAEIQSGRSGGIGRIASDEKRSHDCGGSLGNDRVPTLYLDLALPCTSLESTLCRPAALLAETAKK
jgi:hypothetical protein